MIIEFITIMGLLLIFAYIMEVRYTQVLPSDIQREVIEEFNEVLRQLNDK